MCKCDEECLFYEDCSPDYWHHCMTSPYSYLLGNTMIMNNSWLSNSITRLISLNNSLSIFLTHYVDTHLSRSNLHKSSKNFATCKDLSSYQATDRYFYVIGKCPDEGSVTTTCISKCEGPDNETLSPLYEGWLKSSQAHQERVVIRQ